MNSINQKCLEAIVNTLAEDATAMESLLLAITAHFNTMALATIEY